MPPAMLTAWTLGVDRDSHCMALFNPDSGAAVVDKDIYALQMMQVVEQQLAAAMRCDASLSWSGGLAGHPQNMGAD